MTTGDVKFSANYVKKIQEVTAEQVKAAARKYLTFDKMVVTRLVPKDKFQVAPPAARRRRRARPRSSSSPMACGWYCTRSSRPGWCR